MSIKKTLIVAMLAFSALFPFLSLAAETSPEEAKVVNTMQSLLTAMSHGDVDEFHNATCPGFYAFDSGKQLSRDDLMGMAQKIRASGVSYIWQVTQPMAHVDGNTAWITYINQGSITKDGAKSSMQWLESAVLSRTADGWCVRFGHSTRVPSAS